MKNATKFFFRSVSVAAVLCAVAAGYTAYHTHQLAEAINACEAQFAASRRNFEVNTPAGALKDFQLSLVTCDPYDLLRETLEPGALTPKGKQGAVLAAFKAQNRDLPIYLYLLAGFVAFVGVMPTFWYFILARLAEVAAAVRRN